LELEKMATTIPPTIPAMIPLNTLGKPLMPSAEVEAKPIPRQRGRATKKTTSPAGRSCLTDLKNVIMNKVLEINYEKSFQLQGGRRAFSKYSDG
jgi:hypothetical protein